MNTLLAYIMPPTHDISPLYDVVLFADMTDGEIAFLVVGVSIFALALFGALLWVMYRLSKE